jgi:hypothetical protein
MMGWSRLCRCCALWLCRWCSFFSWLVLVDGCVEDVRIPRHWYDARCALEMVEMGWHLRLGGRSCYAIAPLVCFEGPALGLW